MLKKDSLVVYFVLAKEWISDTWKRELNKAHKKGVKIIVFTQDDLEDVLKTDLTISYGETGSHNYGYYSLTFLCDLIYSLIMNRNPEFHS